MRDFLLGDAGFRGGILLLPEFPAQAFVAQETRQFFQGEQALPAGFATKVQQWEEDRILNGSREGEERQSKTRLATFLFSFPIQEANSNSPQNESLLRQLTGKGLTNQVKRPF